MIRPADAAFASELGVAYVGAIFAPGPRRASAEIAREVFDSAREQLRVGVFGTNDVREVSRTLDAVDLDIVQLHADPTADDVHAMRSGFGGDVWATVRIAGESLPDHIEELLDAADGVVLDTRSPVSLGGTGRPFSWGAIAGELARVRSGGLVILAGGLTPENVSAAIRLLAPDVVDVASGVEVSPGVKDHDLMRQFTESVGIAEAEA